MKALSTQETPPEVKHTQIPPMNRSRNNVALQGHTQKAMRNLCREQSCVIGVSSLNHARVEKKRRSVKAPRQYLPTFSEYEQMTAKMRDLAFFVSDSHGLKD